MTHTALVTEALTARHDCRDREATVTDTCITALVGNRCTASCVYNNYSHKLSQGRCAQRTHIGAQTGETDAENTLTISYKEEIQKIHLKLFEVKKQRIEAKIPKEIP